MAMACLGLVTLRPLRPERNLPCFISFISRSTDLEDPRLYLRVDFAVDLRADFLAAPPVAFLAVVFLADDFFFADFLADFFGVDFAFVDFAFAAFFRAVAMAFPLPIGKQLKRQGLREDLFEKPLPYKRAR